MKTATSQPMDKFDESNHKAQPALRIPISSSQGRIDVVLAQLRSAARGYATMPIAQRIALAESIQQGYLHIAERSVQAGCKAKSIAFDTPAAAEEWASGPWGVVRQLRLVIEQLRAIEKNGTTDIGKVSRTAVGNLAVQVYPVNAIDGMLFKDVTVDVHLQPHVTEKSLATGRARFYRDPDHQGKVALVLGAGNIAAIGIMDVITKMFNEGKVCLLKMNPVNAYLGPFIEEAFKSAINRHFLAIVYGGAEEGRHLVYHPDIDEVHLTGSDHTYDQIVWGASGPEQQQRKLHNEPLLKKPITSELGNISPVIIVPGPYTAKQMQFQAEAITAAMTMNASFLCNAAKILIMPKGWAGSAAFMQAIQDECAKVEPRQAYYAGAHDRWQSLTKGRDNVTHIGMPEPGALPWTFISGLNAGNENERLFREEPFCSVLSEVQVGSADAVEFLQQAVEFANKRLWGTLNATLIVHPDTLKDPTTLAAFEQAIDKLQYGTVAVNTFPGLSFVFASSPWGAYPGSTSDNIQSGSGFVHNTAMLEGIEKTVIRAPLTSFPKPGFFPSHRTGHIVMRRMITMEKKGSWGKVPGIVWAAIRA